MINLYSDDIEEKGASHTASEIIQQPEVWDELIDSLKAQEQELNGFLRSIYEKHKDVRVIFTGAGTSAFIGDILSPVLNGKDMNVRFEGIPTTDIVSNPEEYLSKNTPTILVSFARSGNSPESVATVKLSQEMITDFYQVVITCNEEGQLARDTTDNASAITILMPEKAHDQGFAMTSSFTCMMISTYTLFSGKYISAGLPAQVNELMKSVSESINEILSFDFTRAVYLGSGILSQLAHESALKMLELTAGRVVAIHESSLGFRHGPKSVLHDQSLVIVSISGNPYTRKYDMDILRELAADSSNMKVVALTEEDDEEIKELANWMIEVPSGDGRLKDDLEISLSYVVFAQILALKKSVQLGITPDNPSPEGRVNRVVKGVEIYDYS